MKDFFKWFTFLAPFVCERVFDSVRRAKRSSLFYYNSYYYGHYIVHVYRKKPVLKSRQFKSCRRV